MLQPSGHNSISDNRIIANFAEGILITNAVGSDQINRIVNNYLENFQNVRIQEGGRPNYQWNDPMTTATNIIGGPVKAVMSGLYQMGKDIPRLVRTKMRMVYAIFPLRSFLEILMDCP